MKQFSEEKSDCSRGAPMGRSEYGGKVPDQAVRLSRVNIDRGGYDDGGAYWGIGQALYMGWTINGHWRRFIRANSRKEAAAELGITDILRIRA